MRVDRAEFALERIGDAGTGSCIDLHLSCEPDYATIVDGDGQQVGADCNHGPGAFRPGRRCITNLVLASIHTNDAVSTPMRLMEMGVEPYLVVAGLRGVLAQRLCRRLCEECKKVEELGSQEALAIGIPEWALDDDGRFPNWLPTGCATCSDTGYRGRLAVCEFLEVTETVAHHIIERSPTQELMRTARSEGMMTMRQAGLMKARDGLTSMTELYRSLG